jgi:hypothetical protein
VRLTVLAEWGRAGGALRGKWIDTLLHEQHLGGIPAAVPNQSPEEVLSAFFYGDHLHWDRAAERRASWAEDPVFDVYYQFHFLGAVAALRWHYVEFGALVEIGSRLVSVFGTGYRCAPTVCRASRRTPRR